MCVCVPDACVTPFDAVIAAMVPPTCVKPPPLLLLLLHWQGVVEGSGDLVVHLFRDGRKQVVALAHLRHSRRTPRELAPPRVDSAEVVRLLRVHREGTPEERVAARAQLARLIDGKPKGSG